MIEATTHDVIMPKTGMYEGDVTLTEWLVADGSDVVAGEPLFVMESDKAEMEIEAEFTGRIRQEARPGLEAPIGTRIGVIVETPGPGP